MNFTLYSPLQVQGIPTLVILDGETGEIINSDGRSAVSEDPEGLDYPWRPLTPSQV